MDQLFPRPGRRDGITPSEPLPAKLGQIVVCVATALWDRVLGQVQLPIAQLHVAHVGDALGVIGCFRMVGEEVGHLLGALQIVGVILHPKTLLIVDGGAGVDADQHVLQWGILLVHIVAVVGDHHRDVQLPAHTDQRLIDGIQVLDVGVTLQL